MKTFYYTIILVLFYTINVYAGIVVVPKEEEPKVEEKKPVEKVEKKELTAWQRCCAIDIDLSPIRNGFFIDHYKKKSKGNFNINVRIGNGNINIRNRW